jgi:hypothetical protein
MLIMNDKNTLSGVDRPKGNRKISMAASKRKGKHSEKKSYLDIATLIRSIQRAEGHMDCFQMGMIDCDQLDCKWRAFCLEVYPVFGTDET